MDVLITNNPLVEASYSSRFEVVFLNTGLTGVLTHVRDCIHKGHVLLTHPLSGSVKPNETLYKSVLLSVTSVTANSQFEESGRACPQLERSGNVRPQCEIDFKSVSIIEECITAAQKFPPKNIPDKYRKDLQIVDLSLIRNAIEKHVG